MKENQTPLRTCVLTRKEAPKEDLIRLVLGPDGQIVADLAGKLPGRGASILPDYGLIEEAIASGRLVGALSRSFQQQVDAAGISRALLDQIEQGLHRRCVNRLGQAKRSGECVAGHEKIQVAVAKGLVPALLISAQDAGGDGQKKMRALVGPDVRQFQCLDRDALSEALGLENVPHAVIAKGNNAALLLADFKRYETLLASRSQKGESPA